MNQVVHEGRVFCGRFWSLLHSTFRGERSVSTWAYRVAMRHLLRQRRRFRSTPAPTVASRHAIRRTRYSSHAAGICSGVAVRDGIYVAPRAGGRWQRITTLPPSDRWELSALGAKLYAYNYDVLLRIDANGRPTRELVHLDAEAVQSLTLFGDELFYVSKGEGESEPSSLWSVPKRGGTPRRLFEHEHFAAAPLLADGAAFYLAHDGLLHRRSLADGQDTILASRQALAGKLASAPAPADNAEPWSWPYPPLPTLLAADDTHLFWVDAALGAVVALPKSGGSPNVIASNLRGVTPLAVDQRYVYIGAKVQKTTTLIRYAKIAGATPEVLATTPYGELPFAVARNAVFWVMRRDDPLESDVDVLGLVNEAGFKGFGRLRSPFETSWYETPLCDFAVSRNALLFSRCNRGDSVVMKRSLDGKEKILGSGFTRSGLIVDDEDAVYFAELGDRQLSKGLPRTLDCCSIWIAPR